MSKDSSPNLVMPVAARREGCPKSQAHTSLSEADVLQGHLGQLLHLPANDAKSDLVAHQPPLSPLLITRLPDLGVTPDTVTCHSLLTLLLRRAHVGSQYNRHRVPSKPTIREGRVLQKGRTLGRWWSKVHNTWRWSRPFSHSTTRRPGIPSHSIYEAFLRQRIGHLIVMRVSEEAISRGLEDSNL